MNGGYYNNLPLNRMSGEKIRQTNIIVIHSFAYHVANFDWHSDSQGITSQI